MSECPGCGASLDQIEQHLANMEEMITRLGLRVGKIENWGTMFGSAFFDVDTKKGSD